MKTLTLIWLLYIPSAFAADEPPATRPTEARLALPESVLGRWIRVPSDTDLALLPVMRRLLEDPRVSERQIRAMGLSGPALKKALEMRQKMKDDPSRTKIILDLALVLAASNTLDLSADAFKHTAGLYVRRYTYDVTSLAPTHMGLTLGFEGETRPVTLALDAAGTLTWTDGAEVRIYRRNLDQAASSAGGP